ncbi:hypothetical protein [Fibrobacter sp. UBA2449]|nr:hypothetical protein [Fibrobacter sp. UBA2449]
MTRSFDYATSVASLRMTLRVTGTIASLKYKMLGSVMFKHA